MRLADLVKELDLDVRSARTSLETEVTGAYASDLLSDVLANSREGNVWLTLQIHQNIVAVATIRSLAGIILVGGREPEDETVEKANVEEIPIAISPQRTFELAGKLYSLGIRGASETE
jgi:hypothetical protein